MIQNKFLSFNQHGIASIVVLGCIGDNATATEMLKTSATITMGEIAEFLFENTYIVSLFANRTWHKFIKNGLVDQVKSRKKWRGRLSKNGKNAKSRQVNLKEKGMT
jgi:hypothetical protein